MATLTNQAGQTVTVPDAVAGDYIAEGWTVPGAPALPSTGPDESWTIAELQAHAAEHGIDLGTAKKKADILEAIAEYDEEPGDEP